MAVFRNVFRPSSVSSSPYGWAGTAPYNYADVPNQPQFGDSLVDILKRNLAYEWFRSGEVGQGYTNPPFSTGAAGRIIPVLQDLTGGSAKILRGFIRRADVSAGDELSKCRLYFMFNPSEISRDYVNYVEQAALDPFNTIYQSGNLVAPPSVLDFNFELFFDRQDEVSTVKDHPGVLVDYQFFDIVVRNVNPDPHSVSPNMMPDNGIIMVSPRDITVVFSPTMTVQGKPTNASIKFEKFSHRMTPTRMRISMTLRATYIGPERLQGSYTLQQPPVAAAASLVPFDKAQGDENLLDTTGLWAASQADKSAYYTSLVSPEVVAAYQNMEGPTSPAYQANNGGSSTPGGAGSAGASALEWARAHVTSATQYSQASGARTNLPYSADCSGLIWQAFQSVGLASAMGWGSYAPNVASMVSGWQSHGWNTADQVVVWDIAAASTGKASALNTSALNRLPTEAKVGDMLVRVNYGNSDHISFVNAVDSGRIGVFGAHGHSVHPQVGALNPSAITTIMRNYSMLVRARPAGAQQVSRVTSPTKQTKVGMF